MRSKILSVLGVAMLVLVGCGDDDDGGSGPAAADNVLDVVAPAASEPTVNDLVAAFNEEQPDVDVTVETVDGEAAMTSALGDDADIAIGPRAWVGNSTDAEPETLGRNVFVIAVAEGNPDGLALDSFAPDSGADTRICGLETSFGNFALSVLSRAGIEPDPSTIEAGCEDETLDAVAAGELDAALMFRAELDVPDGVELVAIDEEQNFEIEFVTVAPGSSEEVEAFTSFLDSDEARSILEDAGYLP